MKLTNTLWFLYFMTFPFYIFPPATPQLADIILFLFLFFNIKKIFFYQKNKFTKSLIVLVSIISITNIIWSIILWHPSFLQNTAYYVYNLFIILLISEFINEDLFLKTTLWGICCSLFLQVALYPFAPDFSLRGTMFFNNPNQLGLWAVNSSIIFYLVSQMIGKYKNFIWVILLITCFFIAYSISRAAFLGIVTFTFFYLLYNGKMFIIPAFIGLFMVGGYLYQNYDKIEAFERISSRIDTEDYSDDDAEGRGYGRITNNPQYLFLGAGEGLITRFADKLEIHSCFGNILFSYGIIPFIIFSFMHLYLFQYGGIRYAFPIFSLFLIGLVYMTLRTSMFWITFFFIFTGCKNAYLSKIKH